MKKKTGDNNDKDMKNEIKDKSCLLTERNLYGEAGDIQEIFIFWNLLYIKEWNRVICMMNRYLVCLMQVFANIFFNCGDLALS